MNVLEINLSMYLRKPEKFYILVSLIPGKLYRGNKAKRECYA